MLSCFCLLLTTMLRVSLDCVSFQMLLAGLWSTMVLLLVSALLVLLFLCSQGKKKRSKEINNYSFSVFISVPLIYLFYFFSTREELHWRHIKCYALAWNHSRKLFLALYNLMTFIECLKQIFLVLPSYITTAYFPRKQIMFPMDEGPTWIIFLARTKLI